LALRRLLSGETPEPEVAARHHDPRARVELGRALASARIPSAMIDVSDGLLADLGHILEVSTLGAEIDEAALPLSASLRAALIVDPDWIGLALSGGEDYELLFTVPPEREPALADLPTAVTRIGTIVQNSGVLVKRPNGELRPASLAGYNHFCQD
jgi:thiamine-monophosphate kinase